MVLATVCLTAIMLFVVRMKILHGPLGDIDIPNSIEYQLKIQINKASVAQLASLPGVGPGLAKSIVEDRNENGPFHNEFDLARVPGIGPARIEQLRDYLDFVVNLPDSELRKSTD